MRCLNTQSEKLPSSRNQSALNGWQQTSLNWTKHKLNSHELETMNPRNHLQWSVNSTHISSHIPARIIQIQSNNTNWYPLKIYWWMRLICYSVVILYKSNFFQQRDDSSQGYIKFLIKISSCGEREVTNSQLQNNTKQSLWNLLTVLWWLRSR